jgi:hypothetical protein
MDHSAVTHRQRDVYHPRKTLMGMVHTGSQSHVTVFFRMGAYDVIVNFLTTLLPHITGCNPTSVRCNRSAKNVVYLILKNLYYEPAARNRGGAIES